MKHVELPSIDDIVVVRLLTTKLHGWVVIWKKYKTIPASLEKMAGKGGF